jgi:xanthine dehydrogenase YagS FAD-binding subunit
MRAFTNIAAANLKDAVTRLQKAQQQGQIAAIVGGGSDMLGMVKENLVAPDILISLKSIRSLDTVSEHRPSGEVRIGGLITLNALSQDPLIRRRYAVLAEAAEQVATPQIRNAGTLAGNICQRPWCWYYRNGFPCYRNGGKECFSENGENTFHAIFGGGPTYIVHPSDTAPALIALGARFRIVGPSGERIQPANEFFTSPKIDPSRENTLSKDEVLAEIHLPPAAKGLRSTYEKVMDREVWTHAVVSVAASMEMDGKVCKSARIVLGGVAPIPWHLPKVEALLAGKEITPDLAARAGDVAVDGAEPLAKNGYKVPLLKAVVKRTLLTLAGVA